MRVVLILSAIFTLILKADISAPVSYEGWAVIPTMIMPVMAPILTMVVLLDTLMSSMLLTQHTGDERKRYRLIVLTDSSVVIIMLAIWLPYFITLLT